MLLLLLFTVGVGLLSLLLFYPFAGSYPSKVSLPPSRHSILKGKAFVVDKETDAYARRVFYVPSCGGNFFDPFNLSLLKNVDLEHLHSWLYIPKAARQDGKKFPVIIMAHGLGCIKVIGFAVFSDLKFLVRF
jgi:hypothetical protein